MVRRLLRRQLRLSRDERQRFALGHLAQNLFEQPQGARRQFHSDLSLPFTDAQDQVFSFFSDQLGQSLQTFSRERRLLIGRRDRLVCDGTA